MSKETKKLVLLTLFLGSGLLQAMESNNEPTESSSSVACECEECSFMSWPKRKTSLPSPSSVALKKLKEELDKNIPAREKLLEKLPVKVELPDESSSLPLIAKCLKNKEK